MWLSEEAFPHEFIFKRTNDAKFDINTIAFNCWCDYLSNPKAIDLSISKNGNKFIDWDNFEVPQKQGELKFKIRPVSSNYSYFKVTIHSNHGDDVTYLNSIIFYNDSSKTSPVKQSTSHLKSPFSVRKKRTEKT